VPTKAYLTVSIREPLRIPDAISTTSYGAALTATGGRPPYRWAVDPTTLVPNFTLEGSTLFGGCAQSASCPLTLTVTDDLGATLTRTVTLTVYDDVVITGVTGALSVGVGAPVLLQFSATGGKPGTYVWRVPSGWNPPPVGLSLDAASGIISGSVDKPGSYSINVFAADSDGNESEVWGTTLNVQ
jgi:hypothetical protein